MPLLYFYMVMPTEVHDLLTVCIASIAMTVPVFITACTEHQRGRTVDGDETQPSPVHSKNSHMEGSPKLEIQTELFVSILCLNVFIRLATTCNVLHCTLPLNCM